MKNLENVKAINEVEMTQVNGGDDSATVVANTLKGAAAGMAAGAAAGCLVGSVGGPVGAAAGTMVGGAVGCMAGGVIAGNSTSSVQPSASAGSTGGAALSSYLVNDY